MPPEDNALTTTQVPAPVSMTREQYQAKYGVAPSIPSAPASPTSSGGVVTMTKAEYQAKYGQNPDGTPITPDVTTIPTKTLNIGDVLGVGVPGLNNPLADTGVQGAVKSAVENVKTAVTTNSGIAPKGIENIPIVSEINKYGVEPVVRGVSTIGAGIGGIFDIGTKVVESMIPQPIKDTLAANAGEAYQKSGFAPVVNKIKDGLASAFQNDPQGLTTATNLLNIAMLGLTPEAKKGAQAITEGAAEQATNASTIAQATIDATKAKAVQTAKTEWEQEAANQGGKAAKIFNKSEARNMDIPQLLTDRGITSYSLMGEDGKFATKPAVTAIKNEADNLYKTSLGTLIKASDANGSTVPLSDIEQSAIDYAKNFNASKGDIAKAVANIRNEFSSKAEGGLVENYGKNGIPLGDAESEKAAHWNEIDWSKISPKTTPDNIFNSSMGHAYQGSIENELESQTGLKSGTIAKMNVQIGRLRQTADFLQEIDGDRPALQPSKTPLGKILKTGVRVAAGAATEGITGGITGGLGGYVLSRPLSDSITEFITRLPESTRASVMEGMKADEPQVYQQIVDAINDMENAKEPLDLAGAGQKTIKKTPAVKNPKIKKGSGSGFGTK